MINKYIKHHDFTEDGDYIYVQTITCDTIAEIREETKNLRNVVTRSNHPAYDDIVWTNKKGKLTFTHTYVVDQVEVAIERRNDQWAQSQQDSFDY